MQKVIDLGEPITVARNVTVAADFTPGRFATNEFLDPSISLPL